MTKEDIKSLARLARLQFDDDEAERFISEMDEIIAFADAVNLEVEGDTSTVKLEGEALPYEKLRADETQPSFPNEKILSGVEGEDGYFTVKRIIK
ncbi:MAG: Asp-tRNA(Asn)/Glu-tRNA(Gln) amidotransferase subunit GatC [Clostridia bacterium]|nr:Asp-tRNA(Asn)/Glu-tRNA(Gln) amidotransferase subunit GatC [Clostridia bacterium]